MNTLKRKREERLAKVANKEVVAATIEVQTPEPVVEEPITEPEIVVEESTPAAEPKKSKTKRKRWLSN